MKVLLSFWRGEGLGGIMAAIDCSPPMKLRVGYVRSALKTHLFAALRDD